MTAKASYQIAIGDRGDDSDKVTLVILISEVEGLRSPAIFDSKSKIIDKETGRAELTNGRGYFVAVQDFKNMDEAELALGIFQADLELFLNEQGDNRSKINFQKRNVIGASPVAQS